MRNTRKGERKPKDAYVPVKFPEHEAEKLRLAARAETKGNVSEFVRRAVRKEIASLLLAA